MSAAEDPSILDGFRLSAARELLTVSEFAGHSVQF
jgi:hypothetical protein